MDMMVSKSPSNEALTLKQAPESARPTWMPYHRRSVLSLSALFLLVAATAAVYWGRPENIDDVYVEPGYVLGIELGSTATKVAFYKDDRVVFVADEDGRKTFPSWVSFAHDKIIHGHAAMEASLSNPTDTVSGMTRLLGRSFLDPLVQNISSTSPFNVHEKDGRTMIGVIHRGAQRDLMPEEIVAMTLEDLKKRAETHLGEKLYHALLTLPTYFSDAQRQAFRTAATLAGFNVVRIMNEPSAAMIAHDLHRKEGREYVLVYDIGGHSYDVTLVSVDDGVFEILATGGDRHLGGRDFDARIVDHFVALYKNKTGTDVAGDNRAMSRLRTEAERVKHVLSYETSAIAVIENFENGNMFLERLGRITFEKLNEELFHRTIDFTRNVLQEARLGKENLTAVILSGGSSRIPKIQELVSQFNPNLLQAMNPDLSGARGAAINGRLGYFSNVPWCTMTIDPELRSSLGIRTAGGFMIPIIRKPAMFPVLRSHLFSTVYDNQTTALIEIYGGEHPVAQDNIFLGQFELSGLPLAPRGVPQIQLIAKVLETDEGFKLYFRADSTSRSASVAMRIERGTGQDPMFHFTVDEKLRAPKVDYQHCSQETCALASYQAPLISEVQVPPK